MRLLDHHQILLELCKATGQFGIVISGWDLGSEFDKDGQKLLAAPYLDWDRDYQVIIDGQGYLLFDAREEMEKYYKMTVGDDGPTELNPYNGNNRVYALSCNNKGELENENT